MLWNLVNKKLFYRYLLAGLAILALVFWTAVAQAPDKNFHLFFFDVGQGDSIFIRDQNNHKILIDGGPDNKVLKLLGEKMPFYDRKIDLVIATHNHSDHLAGLIEVVKRYEIGEIWISGAIHTTPEYQRWLEAIKNQKLKVKNQKSGGQWENGETKLNVFYPLKDFTAQLPDDQHEASLVVKLMIGKNSFLFTGDLGQEEENELVASGQDLRANVLKVPHHGSATSLEENFLAKVNPKTAIISAGRNNRYGHPAPTTLKKLEDRGIIIYRTDKDKTIELIGSPSLPFSKKNIL